MQRWVTTGFLYAGSDVDEENEGEECSTSSVASVDHWTISNKLLLQTACHIGRPRPKGPSFSSESEEATILG